MNTDAKSISELESSIQLHIKRSFAMIKQDLSEGLQIDLPCANKYIWYSSHEWKKKTYDYLNRFRKALNKLKAFMIKSQQIRYKGMYLNIVKILAKIS
jgi:hypothetical protein